jgi:geranylgeranyl diphosphate synthase type II
MGAAMELEGFLAQNKKKMDQRIFSVLPEAQSTTEIDDFYRMMRDYPGRKGKGVRGNLCLLSCGMFGADPSLSLDTAAAIELFESWVLIHDDIEDGSHMRRGDITLHLKHSIPLAINAGDALHNRMWQIICRNKETLGMELTFRIAEEFLHMINQTTEGQHIELSWTTNGRFDLSEDDYYAMCKKKTSWYTCISPLRLGAMIAGTEPGVLESMIEIGLNMGLAFQIQDDLLNLLGDERKYGKEVLGDLREGKRTLPLIHVLASADSSTRTQVETIMAKPRDNKSDEDVRLVLTAMKENGSIRYARKRATELAHLAKDKFQKSFRAVPHSEDKRRIREIIDFVVSREK